MVEAASVDDTLRYLSGFKNLRHALIVFHGGEPLLTPIEEVSAILEYVFSSFEYQPNVRSMSLSRTGSPARSMSRSSVGISALAMRLRFVNACWRV